MLALRNESMRRIFEGFALSQEKTPWGSLSCNLYVNAFVLLPNAADNMHDTHASPFLLGKAVLIHSAFTAPSVGQSDLEALTLIPNCAPVQYIEEAQQGLPFGRLAGPAELCAGVVWDVEAWEGAPLACICGIV